MSFLTTPWGVVSITVCFTSQNSMLFGSKLLQLLFKKNAFFNSISMLFWF